jgi:hypothetical protein
LGTSSELYGQKPRFEVRALHGLKSLRTFASCTQSPAKGADRGSQWAKLLLKLKRRILSFAPHRRISLREQARRRCEGRGGYYLVMSFDE